jgi:hypothetical protein
MLAIASDCNMLRRIYWRRCSSETSVPTRNTRRHIPEDDILHSHRRDNLKSYITGSSLRNLRVNRCEVRVPLYYALRGNWNSEQQIRCQEKIQQNSAN